MIEGHAFKSRHELLLFIMFNFCLMDGRLRCMWSGMVIERLAFATNV